MIIVRLLIKQERWRLRRILKQRWLQATETLRKEFSLENYANMNHFALFIDILSIIIQIEYSGKRNRHLKYTF